MFHFCACSFGKDSIATILLALHHNEPLDEVVFTEVMFDNKRGISGESPEHIHWVKTHAVPLLEAMGVKVRIIPTEVDYIDSFNRIIRRSKDPSRIGKKRAFPIANRCAILRDCKLRTMQKYIRSLGTDCVQYIGLAADEIERLTRKQFRLKGNRISLLEKYGYTEKMAYDLCRRYNLLSPCYDTAMRNGCWFCPNRKLKDIAQFKQAHPELWNELLKLNQDQNKVSECFSYNQTLLEIDKKINWINRQTKLFL